MRTSRPIALCRSWRFVPGAAVVAEHAALINGELTPDADSVARARRLVEAFEAARDRGEASVGFEGSRLEVPIDLNAKHLIARAEALAGAAARV